jgi:hypothetical protein
MGRSVMTATNMVTPAIISGEVTIEEASRIQGLMWEKAYHPLNHADICVARALEVRYGEVLNLTTNSTPTLMVPRHRTAEDRKVAQAAYKEMENTTP